MIRRLRRKFILINMALVSAVLVAVFTLFCWTSFQRAQGENLTAMKQALGRDDGALPPKLELGRRHPPRDAFPGTPVLCVLAGENGQIDILLGEENFSFSEDTLSQAVRAATARGAQEGVLREFDLRYVRRDTPGGVKIAFTDRSRERQSLRATLLTSFLAGLAAELLFFAVSVFLARWALRPVEEAWERQRQFVADASHELKTPLTVILANTDLVLAHPEDTVRGQLRWVENTKAEAVRMKKLLGDLLFLAKSDAARIPVPHTAFSFSDAVAGCLLTFEPVAFEQGIALESAIEPDVGVTGDEGQLRQLAMILLDNACKYSPDGGAVTVRLSRAADKAKLTVHNMGAPVPPEELDRLFERFYRADPSRAREDGGYGLGLAIAKSIAENHRGTIRARSGGDGTTFTVTLPLLRKR